MISIKEGFRHLTNQQAWYKKCKLHPKLKASTARSQKQHFIKGSLSEEKMIELLRSAGYKIIEAKCELPKNSPNE